TVIGATKRRARAKEFLVIRPSNLTTIIGARWQRLLVVLYTRPRFAASVRLIFGDHFSFQ
ncbi:MAG: hypothetical protein AAF414_24455, partial [Pseudomonadota bacterium]